jgi:hypothetical protein
MLFKSFILFALITPLLGLIQLENGAFSWTLSESGHPNGASVAFAFYVLFMLVTILAVTKGRFFALKERVDLRTSQRSSIVLSFRRALLLNLSFALIFIFAMGGYQTILGMVGKGEFRTSIGFVGSTISKWLAPAVFAYLCALKLQVNKFDPVARKVNWLLWANGILVFMIGVSWGFKTMAISMLLPGLIILTWNSNFVPLIKIILFSVVTIFALFWLFDSAEDTTSSIALELLWERLTILQGDVPWYLWEKYIQGSLNYDYLTTVSVAIGDTTWSALTGINEQQHPELWVLSHFGYLITYATGYSVEGILGGHNVTGTAFSEGLIAGGALGGYGFGILAGCIIGLTYNGLRKSIKNKQSINTALWSCYSVFCVFSWIASGGIVVLFHIAIIANILLAWLCLKFISVAGLKISERSSVKRSTIKITLSSSTV